LFFEKLNVNIDCICFAVLMRHESHALIDTIWWKKRINKGEFPVLIVFLAVFFLKFDKKSQKVSIRGVSIVPYMYIIYSMAPEEQYALGEKLK